jgi:hypothetical protein
MRSEFSLKRSFQSAVLPFSAMERNQDLLDFAVADHAAYAHAAHVVAGHHYFQAAGFDVEKIELFHRGAD